MARGFVLTRVRLSSDQLNRSSCASKSGGEAAALAVEVSCSQPSRRRFGDKGHWHGERAEGKESGARVRDSIQLWEMEWGMVTDYGKL